jgi:nicotinate-nucleotide pyrophosphorylase (carboxylating)
MSLLNLPANIVNFLVEEALKEDIGTGDVTSNALLNDAQIAKFKIIAKEDLVLCGIEFAIACFVKLNDAIKIEIVAKDAAKLHKGDVILTGEGKVKDILLAERVALNFLQHLSAIATNTNSYVEKVAKYKVKILDTRKTIPMYREAAKYAVRVGGGKNHRMRLDDAILIKDNHVAAVGKIAAAIKKVRENSKLDIIVECDYLNQVEEACKAGCERVMLDNMNTQTVTKAIKIINSRAEIEVSGGINLDNIGSYAKLGVDYISVGAITHTIKSCDISLEILK